MDWFSNEKQTFTLIDPKINALILNDSFSNDSNETDYFVGKVFNWKNIQELLENYNIQIDSDKFTYESCLKCCQILQPIWKQCTKISEDIKLADLNSQLWASNGSNLKICLESEDKHQTRHETNIIEGILIITSILEHSLGNVYFSITKHNPPHLLRDLLKTNEIIEIFGKFPIFFLQIILGTPNSLNLRNIVWHGFPNPKEIPDYYLSVLIVSMLSLSKILDAKLLNIKNGIKIKYDANYFEDINCNMDELNALTNNEIITENILRNSINVPESHKVYWKIIYKYFYNKNYEKFIILICPQIELLFRVIYGKLNQYDVSAKINEYYITMDSIFDVKLPDNLKMNKILTEMNDGILKLSYDLFICPNGPRIRDKVSHGEMELSSLDHKVCLILLILSLVLMKENQKTTEISFKFVYVYESKFHPNSIFKKNLNKCLESLCKLDNIEIPEGLMNYISKHKKYDGNEVVVHSRSSEKLKIFNRHSKESEIVGLLNRILVKVEQSCENLLNSLIARFALLNQKQLRSKRRKTLEKMVASMAEFQFSIRKMLQFSYDIIERLQADLDFSWIENNNEKCIRFLKSLLKSAENLSNYCRISNNKWEESNKICSNFNDTVLKYYEKLNLQNK